MISAGDFWGWFKKNNAKYFFLNQIDNKEEKEKLLNDFLVQLHQYSDKLFFEIGGHPDEEQDLIITAEGNTNYFSKVEELVGQAPRLKDWNIIAFKPPKEFGFITQYNDITLDPRQMWFTPLNNPDAPHLIGLKMFLKNFDPKKEQEYLFATSIALDNILGEQSNAENIAHIEVENISSKLQEENLIEVSELPNYIRWAKRQTDNEPSNQT